jgi:MYXO-CTERM domain-containing protein
MKSTRSGRAGLGLVSGMLALGASAPGHAVVTEPNGLQAPIPVAQAEIGFANTYNPPAVVTLSGLFQARGETIDWLQDAHTSPEVFSPQCAFTGELVLHGGACKIDFGWYNVDQSRTTPVPDSEIYTIIPGSMIQYPWHPGVGEDGPVFTTDTIRADARYKGGLIGFALKGDPGQDCKQTHFSEQKLNPTCSMGTCAASPAAWHAAVVWQSTKTPNAYYIGFEDLPMGPSSSGPSDFGSIPGQSLKCDGDFNDFVYFLSGLTCDGGGTACDTGMPGVCAGGLNECVTGTTLRCKPTVTASKEVCDGLDNDCNGMVDDNAPCPNNQVCDRGVCVPPCSNTEFPCAPGDTCVGGLCVEKACVGVTCDTGQTCKGGTCAGPCTGVTCPGGRVCRVGRCVDPCDDVTCEADRVCEGGVCVPSCKCAGCKAGKTCDASGRCLDTGCVGKTCAASEICAAGTCADRCAGAVCPHDQTCTAGDCVDVPKPDGGTYVPGGTGLAGATGSSTGLGTGAGGASGAGLTGGAAGSTLPVTNPDAAVGEKITPSNGCRCDAGPTSTSGAGWLAALALAALVARRRRS